MKHLKLLLAHIIIAIISVLVFSGYRIFLTLNLPNIIYAILHVSILAYLYTLSGYIITDKNKKFKLYSYGVIAFIGIIIWALAMIDAPTDIDWKNGDGGKYWFSYILYTNGISLSCAYLDSSLLSVFTIKQHQFLLLALSIIPSALQALGGFLKTRKKTTLLTNS